MQWLIAALAALALIGVALVWRELRSLMLAQANAITSEQLEQRHRDMLRDLHQGLTQLGDRTADALAAASERQTRAQSEAGERLRQSLAAGSEALREAVGRELRDTRAAMDGLRDRQQAQLAENRESLQRELAELSLKTQQRQDALREELLGKLATQLAEQGKLGQETIQATMRHATELLAGTIEKLNLTVREQLDAISGKVHERLEEGFKKTNETFVNVMARLATIDEAQKKIESLSGNVISLQELLGDKRSRGAFGEVQLEHLIRNLLPESTFEMQVTLSSGVRADCVLTLPPPTGRVAVDAKFPLENYRRMFDAPEEGERKAARMQFVRDVRGHINAIADKYILPGETADGAVMFVPAEAVFAEIHAYHAELVQYAQERRVWIVSPTTLMAVLNTARAVLRDAQMREQLHVMQVELVKLAEEFGRFDTRMKKLADHIRQAYEDSQQVQVTSQKISKRFAAIERVQLDADDDAPMLEEENGA